jgi:hypothetical protein
MRRPLIHPSRRFLTRRRTSKSPERAWLCASARTSLAELALDARVPVHHEELASERVAF